MQETLLPEGSVSEVTPTSGIQVQEVVSAAPELPERKRFIDTGLSSVESQVHRVTLPRASVTAPGLPAALNDEKDITVYQDASVSSRGSSPSSSWWMSSTAALCSCWGTYHPGCAEDAGLCQVNRSPPICRPSLKVFLSVSSAGTAAW